MAKRVTVPVGFNNSDSGAKERVNPARVKPTGKSAVPTSRLLDGSDDHGYAQEWQEEAKMPDGRKCMRMYLFTQADMADSDGNEYEDAENLPWDDEHVARIILLD